MNSVHQHFFLSCMKHLAHFEKMYLYDFMTIFSDQLENSYQTEKHNCNLAVPFVEFIISICIVINLICITHSLLFEFCFKNSSF